MSTHVVDRLAAALHAHVDARRRADERLASFAFSERPDRGTPPGGAPSGGAPSAGAPSGGDRDATRAGVTDWRYFATRTLRLAGDPGTLRLLDRLRDGAVGTANLADALDPDERGHLALVERIGDLAAAGLVARELGRDEVRLAPLGEAVLDLVAEIERRAGADAS
jgi:hypothetical protein